MKMPRLVIPILALLVGLAGAPGCASLPRIPQLPAQVETVTDRDLTAVVGNLEQLLTLATRAALSVSRIEDEAARNGVISATADAKFDAAATAFYTAARTASDRLVHAGLSSWPEIRSLVAPVLERGQQLIDLASGIGAIKSKVAGFLAQLRDTLSAAAGELLFGGAR